jgi:hypothetical protein
MRGLGVVKSRDAMGNLRHMRDPCGSAVRMWVPCSAGVWLERRAQGDTRIDHRLGPQRLLLAACSPAARLAHPIPAKQPADHSTAGQRGSRAHRRPPRRAHEASLLTLPTRLEAPEVSLGRSAAQTASSAGPQSLHPLRTRLSDRCRWRRSSLDMYTPPTTLTVSCWLLYRSLRPRQRAMWGH